MQYRYVFGPVTSGRLGRSLGLDLTGTPTCTQDCLYCEAGPTTDLTTRREVYAPAGDILAELADWRDTVGGPLDVVTLGGMGEPTLNSEFGDVIDGVRDILPGVDVAVLTNSTTLGDPAVRKALCKADLLLPSLDTLVEAEYTRLCRPAKGVTAASIAQGLLDLRAGCDGRLRLEVLLAKGVNDTDANLRALEAFVDKLRPEAVDVVTVTRPPAYSVVKPAGAEALERFRTRLNARLETAPERKNHAPSPISLDKNLTDGDIQEMVRRSLVRRPQTAEQLSAALGLPLERVRAAVTGLTASGDLTMVGDEPYYKPKTI